MVLAPLHGEKLLELARYARDYHSVKLHVLSIYSLIEYLCTNKRLESILELGPSNHNSVKELCMERVDKIEEIIKQLVNNEGGLGQSAEGMRGMGYMIILALVYKMYSLLNSGVQGSPSFNWKIKKTSIQNAFYVFTYSSIYLPGELFLISPRPEAI